MGDSATQGASALGTVLAIKGTLDQGKAADRNAKAQARLMRQNANQQIASATVAMREEERKKDLTASRAIAVAAASGAGTLDPTVVRILQGIEAEGALASATQLYNGMESARGMRLQADATEWEGKMAKSNAKTKALTTALGAGDKFNFTWGSSTDTFKAGTSSRPNSAGDFTTS